MNFSQPIPNPQPRMMTFPFARSALVISAYGFSNKKDIMSLYRSSPWAYASIIVWHPARPARTLDSIWAKSATDNLFPGVGAKDARIVPAMASIIVGHFSINFLGFSVGLRAFHAVTSSLYSVKMVWILKSLFRIPVT